MNLLDLNNCSLFTDVFINVFLLQFLFVILGVPVIPNSCPGLSFVLIYVSLDSAI